MGPEGGDQGGEVVAAGTPEQIVKRKGSYTAEYLRPKLTKPARERELAASA
jgi:excinuclease ABC subunit A